MREVLAQFGLDERYDALIESGVLVTEGVAPR